MIAGLNGAIASTVVAGVDLIRRGVCEPTGLLTETERMPTDGRFGGDRNDSRPLFKDVIGLAQLEDMHFGGWDLTDMPLAEACIAHRIVPRDYREALDPNGDYHAMYGGIVSGEGKVARGGKNPEEFSSWREALEAARADIRDFKQRTGVDQVVVVCLLPTLPPPVDGEAHTSPVKFEEALEGTGPELTAPIIYLRAACDEGCAWVNFTPNMAEIPVLQQYALETDTPIAGRDGKTGQTLMKTVLAPAFRARDLKVRGWFSTNILGNPDGKALRDPAALLTKLKTKASNLDHILGYRVGTDEDPAHVVMIHYYPPRGDAKEAWDNIDIEGFLGVYMQVKTNFLCKDSILAAPLIIDLARFAGNAKARGERGWLPYLAQYFKQPEMGETELVHSFPDQMSILAKYVESCAD